MSLLDLLRKELSYYLSRLNPKRKTEQYRPAKASDIMRSGKRNATPAPVVLPPKPPKKRSLWKIIILSILLVGLVAILATMGLIRSIYKGNYGAIPEATDLQHIQNYNASEIYTADKQLLGKYFIENRADVAYEDISPYVMQALVATEDARFFEHSGIDYRAMMRVLWKSVLQQKEEAGGGSTLSQQLAKNLYPRSREHGWLSLPISKVKEMIIARRLEEIYSKEELLNLYLNTVSFSDNVFGIKIAAQRFFNSSSKNLSAEQAALLIGTLKGTSSYHPVRHPERALARRNVVLQQMQKYEHLSLATYDSLIQLPLQLDYNKRTKGNKVAPYFKEAVRLELADLLKNNPDLERDYNVYTDGLKIYTSLDSRLQAHAEAAVQTHIHKLQKNFDRHWKGKKHWGSDKLLQQSVKRSKRYKNLQAQGLDEAAIQEAFSKKDSIRIYHKAGGEITKFMSPLDSVKYYLSLLHAGFLAAEPSTGAVKAWVGGIDYGHFQYDHIRSKRQVGSTFKPVVYAAALKKGLEPCHYFQNELVSYPKWENWQPKNATGQYGGFYSMAGGLSKSINTVTVEVLFHTGISKVRQLAKQVGIVSDIPQGPAIALGTVEASLYEMVQVYSTFANRGKKVNLHFIERIEDSEGKLLYEAPTAKSERILNSTQSDIMTKLLESVIKNGTGRPLNRDYGVSGEIAGKTGTTQNQSDGWFIAYNPKLVAGAWVGAESPHVHFRTLKSGMGSKTALPVYGEFMRRLYKDKAFKSIRFARFPKPSAETLTRLECDAFLSDELLDSVFEPEEDQNLMDRIFRPNRPQAAHLEDGEIDPQELENMEREVARLERKAEKKEKRKAFWSDLLFGKDKKKEGN